MNIQVNTSFDNDFILRFENLFSKFNQQSKLLIITHQKPDGDALGSSLALYIFLKKLYFNVTIISPTNWPNFFEGLPEINAVINFEENTNLAEEHINSSDFIFCLDFNTLERTHLAVDILKKISPEKMILIDHHQTPQIQHFANIFSNSNFSSTAELIFELLYSYKKELIDEEIATCLYVGIMTDTGNFQFNSTHSSTHHIAAILLSYGLNIPQIHQAIYHNYDKNRLFFIGHIFSQRLFFLAKDKVALLAINYDDIKKFNITTGDTEGIINMLFTVKLVNLAAMVVDRGNVRKWSFRSNNSFDVNYFARAHFNGGGHLQAAGGSSAESLEDTKNKFIKLINNCSFK